MSFCQRVANASDCASECVIESDFNINVRYSTYDMKTKRYGSRDVCKPIGKEEMQKLIKRLGYELASKQEEEKALEDSPF